MFKTFTKDFLEDPKLEMDITEETDEITLFGNVYRMYRDEWKHHVHLKCTNICDANCSFCIERSSRNDKNCEKSFLSSTSDLLKQMHEQKQLYTVSITGGEPTMFSGLNRAIEMVNSYPLKLFSMNTNGRHLESISPYSINGWVNISKHCIHDKSVFKRNWEVTPEYLENVRGVQPLMKVRFQCVLGVDGGLSSIDDVREFMDTYQDTVDDFSFRSLIIENAEGEVPSLFRNLRRWMFDCGWCVEQTIQDYYVYEIFRPTGMKPIAISWSNMGLLRAYNETHGGNFLEEIIVHPDGMITGSWNRKSLVIKHP